MNIQCLTFQTPVRLSHLAKQWNKNEFPRMPAPVAMLNLKNTKRALRSAVFHRACLQMVHFTYKYCQFISACALRHLRFVLSLPNGPNPENWSRNRVASLAMRYSILFTLYDDNNNKNLTGRYVVRAIASASASYRRRFVCSICASPVAAITAKCNGRDVYAAMPCIKQA